MSAYTCIAVLLNSNLTKEIYQNLSNLEHLANNFMFKHNSIKFFASVLIYGLYLFRCSH